MRALNFEEHPLQEPKPEPMKLLFVSQSLIDVESRKELLDQAEIPSMIKNQRSAMLGGEIPFVEVFPELWVLYDEDLERAQASYITGIKPNLRNLPPGPVARAGKRIKKNLRLVGSAEKNKLPNNNAALNFSNNAWSCCIYCKRK